MQQPCKASASRGSDVSLKTTEFLKQHFDVPISCIYKTSVNRYRSNRGFLFWVLRASSISFVGVKDCRWISTADPNCLWPGLHGFACNAARALNYNLEVIGYPVLSLIRTSKEHECLFLPVFAVRLAVSTFLRAPQKKHSRSLVALVSAISRGWI